MPSLRHEKRAYNDGATIVAGVDEAGRGPLAGPVVAAAAILPRDFRHKVLNDSKQLTPEQRDELYAELTGAPRRPLGRRRLGCRSDRRLQHSPRHLAGDGVRPRRVAGKARLRSRGRPARSRHPHSPESDRRRRRQEFFHCRRQRDRQGHARPHDAESSRAVSAIQFCPAQRLRHARTSRGAGKIRTVARASQIVRARCARPSSLSKWSSPHCRHRCRAVVLSARFCLPAAYRGTGGCQSTRSRSRTARTPVSLLLSGASKNPLSISRRLPYNSLHW